MCCHSVPSTRRSYERINNDSERSFVNNHGSPFMLLMDMGREHPNANTWWTFRQNGFWQVRCIHIWYMVIMR